MENKKEIGMKRNSTGNGLGVVFLVLVFSLLGEWCVYSETNATVPADADIAIPDQDSDFDGIPDSKDPFPIIASYSVFKWEVNSASLDYDVQQTSHLDSGYASRNLRHSMSCERLQWLRQMLHARTFHKCDCSAKSFPTTFLEIFYQKVAESFFAFRMTDECNHVCN
jgi:hypothetical protein